MPDPSAIEPLVQAIRPLLAGKHAAVQGATLADLLAIWLAGHPPEVREEMLAMHVAEVRNLIPPNAAIIRGER